MFLTTQDIIDYFPVKYPYKYIDEITELDDHHIEGNYTFRKNEFFLEGHFPGFPVIPGAILQECAEQIGLLAFGMYLLGNKKIKLTQLPSEMISDHIRTAAHKFKAAVLTIPDHIPLEIRSCMFYLISTEMSYKRIVQPDEKIIVIGEKVFFKFNKLKCNIRIETPEKDLIAKGTLAGMILTNQI